MRKYFFLIFLFLSVQKCLKAQSDTAFWFAAPDIEIVNHPLYGEYDRPIYLRLTSFTSAANVIISIPANPGFTPININIPANSTTSVNLTTWINLIENSDPVNVGNKGIYIRSTTDITAYYEVNSVTCNCNPELFSLKAKNAIGNEFYIPSQLTWAVDTPRHPNAKTGFDIVATQNSTTVTVTPTKALIGHPANVPFTITLNRGQSYACIGLYRNGSSMLNGSKVVSDKPVAVTTYEDLLFSDGACADLAGDQLIPTSIFGTEFAVVRGNLTTRDKVIVTASQNNTKIYLNGNAAPTATINAGQSYEHDLLPAAPILYIKTDKLANVFHYTGSGCEVGAAVIPKLNCTGSSSVSLVRASNGGNASVMLVTKTANQGSFLVSGAAGIITAADFSPIPGTAGVYVYAKKDVTASMPLNVATRFSNTTGKFQLGFFDVLSSNGGCMYGYFSDFKKSNVSSSQLEVCRLDSAQLNAVGGVTYQWSPPAGLSNPNISNPKASPAVTTDYKVVITDSDGCIDSAFVKVIVNACALTCNNWLKTQAVGQSVTVGDLDVTGNQITIEANFNCTSFPLSRPDKQEDIVSKHSNTTDINYVLRMDLAGITTTNGQFLTPFPCDNLVINKTYHVALVYNGSTLKFYRDGFLMSQIAATGNLITNNWQTTIGDYAVNNPQGTNFLGYINEVRIWNVARTQTELRTYMDVPLPNPPAQTGLLAYYTFDDLLNKQGNASWNGTLNSGATINNTNPNCSFTADSCALASCDTWLKTTANGDYVTIGDLDITGNQLTVEAAFNRTASLNSGLYYGHLISKHSNASDVNYSLLPNGCEITTSNGYKSSFQTCLPDLNKTYHVAMVYDGINLKYYRNGILISQVACTGNLVTNDLQTTIAQVAGAGFPPDNQFKGYINEVRIWNVARTQAEIQTYMNTSLPSPTTQTGLKGYYVFNNLLNKQGNPAYNATLNGGATINTTNLNCTFTPEIVAIANAGPDTAFCSNTTVSHILRGTGNGTTYSWSPAIYLNNPNIQNPTATISATTTFYLAVSSASACSAIDSVTIYVNQLPVVKTLTDTAICKGSVLVLTTTAGLGTYHWSPGIYVSDSTIASPVFIDNQPRTLYVTGTTAFGCSAKDTINIIIKPSPVVKTIEDTLICSTNQVTLFTGGAQTYTWTPTIFLSNPNIASPVFSGNSSQTYYVTGTAANGCTAKDTVSVNVNVPMTMLAPPNKSMCVNGSVQLDGYNGTTVAYLWSPATYLSSTTIINPIANPPASTFYTVKISDLACIHDSTFTVQVIVSTGLAITVSKSNDVDCAIRSANLLASGGDTYLWTPSTGLSNPNIPNPVASPINTQKYVVRVSNALGCFNTDSVTVYSNLKASLARYMPNAFTPNGDGLNDCYGLKNWMHIKKLEFRIFNRYGEQVFGTSSLTKCWDGTYKGKKADPGGYVFYIKAETDCGTEEQKGNFLLIR